MAGARTTRHKSVTRIDHPAKHTFGYLVRIRWKGVEHRKFFSDRKLGDRLGALSAALEWRDATERELGKPRTEQPVVSNPRLGASGIQGIRRMYKGERAYYEATWTIEPGRLGRTRFSITKHGEAKARRMALKARKLNEARRLAKPRRPQVVIDMPKPSLIVPPPQQPPVDDRWSELLQAAEARGQGLYPF